MTDIALEYLEQAYEAMKRDHDLLIRRMADVREIIDAIKSGGPASTSDSRNSVPSVRDIVLEVGMSQPVFKLEDVMAAARQQGNTSSYASVSSVVSRMRKTGELDPNTPRGLYALREDDGDTPWGAPVEQDHEGGDGDASASVASAS